MNAQSAGAAATAASSLSPLREDVAGVAVLTLNHPQTRNSLSEAMLEALGDALTAIAHDDTVRAVVLAANGPAFSAGHDLKELNRHRADADRGRAYFKHMMTTCSTMMQQIVALPQPVIAAVQGPAMGGGFELVLACDAVFASEESRFSLPEVNLGLLPGGGGTQKLTRLLGRLRVKEIIMTGRTISSREAATVGLVNNVVPAHQVLPVALEYARLISTKPALAIKLAKRLVNGGTDASLGTALDYEQAVLAGLFTTEDGREGIQAFVQKRAPSFRGA